MTILKGVKSLTGSEVIPKVWSCRFVSFSPKSLSVGAMMRLSNFATDMLT